MLYSSIEMKSFFCYDPHVRAETSWNYYVRRIRSLTLLVFYHRDRRFSDEEFSICEASVLI